MTTIDEVISGAARFTVVCADNREILNGMPRSSIHHLITDPPYSERVHSKSRAGNRKTPLLDGNGHLTRCAIDREVDFGFDPITQDEMEWLGDKAQALTIRWSLMFSDLESAHLWSGAMSSAGLDFCRTGVWVKTGCTPQFTGDRPACAAEAITIMHQPGKKRWNGGGSRALWEEHVVSGNFANHNNTREHPTQKPLKLMMRLIEQFTDPDDIILDPYAGSGSTGVAALRLGRRCVMIEKQQKHADEAHTRCAAEVNMSDSRSQKRGQVALFGAP